MKTYLVGGAVRDKLLGKEPHDKDYVVIGSTVEEMLSHGFIQVGKDFPVFLHPETGEEYALARTERKTGSKHTDFSFEFSSNITLEEDLIRRDFTINTMAMDMETGEIIDYFNGLQDLENKILRAVRPETFVEDPLRVLRGCRFAAQLDFEIAHETMELMKKMVEDGMINHLTAERVWKETEKALSEGYNSKRYFEILNECGALKVLMPGVYSLVNTPEQVKYHPSGNTFKHTMIALNRVRNKDSITKWVVVCHDLGKGNTPENILPKHNNHDERGIDLIESLCKILKTPTMYKDFAKTFCKNHMRMAKFLDMSIKKQYDMVKELSNNFKDINLLNKYCNCFYADYMGEEELTDYNNPAIAIGIIELMQKYYKIMENVSLKDLPKEVQDSLSHFKGEKFGKLYREAMINYLRKELNE